MTRKTLKRLPLLPPPSLGLLRKEKPKLFSAVAKALATAGAVDKEDAEGFVSAALATAGFADGEHIVNALGEAADKVEAKALATAGFADKEHILNALAEAADEVEANNLLPAAAKTLATAGAVVKEDGVAEVIEDLRLNELDGQIT